MNPPTTDRCLIGQREHQPTHGLLCEHHLQQLGRLLRDIEDGATDLDVRLSMAVGYDSSHGGTLASHRAPVRLDVLVLLDRRRGTGITRGPDFDDHGWDDTPSILESLHSWARLIRDERQLAAPGHVTISGERDTLTRQLDWAARQPWIDELYAEMADLAARIGRANATIEVPAGVCETAQPDGVLCDGTVWHVLIKPDGTVERNQKATPHADDEPGFRCSRCRRVWTGTEAVRLRDRMWRDEQQRKATA